MMPPLVILAGGLATRMGEVTKLQPKSLLPVAGMPFIFHQLNWVRKQGFTRVILSIGHLGEKIEEYVGAGDKFGLDITYSTDGPELLGTGGALKKAVTDLHEPFFVMYGDSYLQINAEEMWNKYSFYEKLSMLSVIKNDNKWDKSNCDFIDGFITAHSKKNITKDMKYIDYGLGIINPSVFHDYPVEQKFDLSEVYEQLACKKQLTGFEVRERFYEIGSIAGLQETEQYINQLKKS